MTVNPHKSPNRSGGTQIAMVGAAPVEPMAVSGQEDQPVCAFADGQVDGPGVRGASGIVTTFRPCG